MAMACDTQQTKKLLTCCICKDILKEPKTLRCFHSFCKKCLAENIKSQREKAEKSRGCQFNCPLCRAQFQLRQGESVEQLSPNVFIDDLLKVFSGEKRVDSCEHCEVSAACKCVECEHYLCNDCLREHHKWPANNDHGVLTLEELARPENQAKSKRRLRCDKEGHEDKLFGLYCKTCQELACITCAFVDHSKTEHDCEPVSVAANRQKEALKTTAVTLNKKSVKSQETLGAIKYASRCLLESNKTAKDAILQQEKEILEEFTKRLKERTAALIVEVDKKHNEVNQNLVKQHDDMKAYEAEVSGSLEFAKNIIEQGSNDEILLFGKEIKANADNIEKRNEPEAMQPIYDCELKYEAKTTGKVLEAIKLDDLGKIGM